MTSDQASLASDPGIGEAPCLVASVGQGHLRELRRWTHTPSPVSHGSYVRLAGGPRSVPPSASSTCRGGRWRRCGPARSSRPQEPLPRVPSLTGEAGHAEGKSLARGHRSTEWGQVSAHASWPWTPRSPPSPCHTGATPGSRGGGGRQHAGRLLELEEPQTSPPRGPHTRCRSCFHKLRVRHGFTSQETPTRSPASALRRPSVSCGPRQLPRVTLGTWKCQNLRCPLIIHVLLRKSSLGGKVGSTIQSFETHKD